MDEIKVGEYVRTQDGIIDRIVIAENDDEMYAGERDPEYLDYVREDIIKHSSNIIDLVEERRLYNARIQIT